MSSRGFIISFPAGTEGVGRDTLLRRLARYSPSQGWTAFALLAVLLMVVGGSVSGADWVETPGLMGVMVVSALTGLVLAKARAPAIALHPAGLLLGFVVIVWQISSLADGESGVGRVPETWDRLVVWYQAATTGGISTDLLPFSLAVLTVAWLIGYVGSWFLFRRSNVWVAVLLAGVAILTNLSFLPDRFVSQFFLFAFFAMLLLVRVSVVQRQEAWSRTGVTFEQLTGWLTLHAALWFSLVVIIVAAALPMQVYVSAPLARTWNAGREPIENLEDEFARLFSGIAAQKDGHGRFFGKTLPFLGKISFAGNVVFWADTDYPSYWLSQTYSEYTSKGWIVGDSHPIEAGPDVSAPPRSDFLERLAVDQTLQLAFPTSEFLSGGSLDWVSRDATARALSPREFVIDIENASEDRGLPDDLQALAPELRRELASPPENFVESFVSKSLPTDLVLLDLGYVKEEDGEERLVTVRLARKEPITPDVVSWKLDDRLPAQGTYSMVSFVSLADDNDLRSAETDYSTFITDHYLQLPANLPDRVRVLAEGITAGADNPMDKALAIQSFLRDGHLAYDQDIDAPPPDADGVDHFLFESQTGYSDYFGSSMTVLLRAAGVPARMAAGFAPGDYDEESNVRVVRDLDSHGWTQVFFPDYGWIDFEPTPRWPVHERRIISGPGSDLIPDFLGEGSDADLFGEEDFLEDTLGIGIGGFGDGDGPQFRLSIRTITNAAIGLGGLAFLWTLGFLAWNWGLAGAPAEEKAYAKMGRLGAMAGIGRRRQQTPVEFGSRVGLTVPDVEAEARRIGSAFAAYRYAQAYPDEQDTQRDEEMEKAWKKVRGPLLGRVLRRMITLGGNPTP